MNIWITPIRQQLADIKVDNVAAEVRQGLQALKLGNYVRPEMRIAIAVGSRGIFCLPEVARTIIEELIALGAEPFFVPAMGSHGSATAEGQRTILEESGLRFESLPVPILSSMETVQIGSTPQGMPVFLDVHAHKADGIFAINRIKPHTSFRGRWESGLMKILAIGLGKARGAAEIHKWGIRDAMPAAARVILAQTPVIAGIGIVENGYHQPARIDVLPASRIEAEEPALLDLARQFLPGIPLEPLDLLIVQQMGKDISGTGMDPNVIGMWRRAGGPIEPFFKIVAVLDLTPRSHGNAIGVGFADLIPARLREAIDLDATYTNCLTARNFPAARIPLTLPTDREVLRAGLMGTAEKVARIAIIRNTLNLDVLWVSQPLMKEVHTSPMLKSIGPAQPMSFTADGRFLMPDIPGA